MSPTIQIPVPTVEQGDLALIQMAFADALTGEPVNPVAITVQIRNGADYTETTYTYGVGQTILQDGLGQFHADIDTTNLLGPCRAEVISDPDGTANPICQTAAVAYFVVRPLPA